MPKRKTAVQKVDASQVQGEGAWVEVRKLKWGEIKKLSRQRGAAGGDEEQIIEMTDELLAEHVLAWNWVDEDGNPLPQPHGNLDVIDDLTDEEFAFLGEVIGGSEQDRKN